MELLENEKNMREIEFQTYKKPHGHVMTTANFDPDPDIYIAKANEKLKEDQLQNLMKKSSMAPFEKCMKLKLKNHKHIQRIYHLIIGFLL